MGHEFMGEVVERGRRPACAQAGRPSGRAVHHICAEASSAPAIGAGTSLAFVPLAPLFVLAPDYGRVPGVAPGRHARTSGRVATAVTGQGIRDVLIRFEDLL